MPSRSKSKGNACERRVAEDLTNWWQGSIPFHRIPNSGALRWGDGASFTFGDLLPPPDCNAIFEIKHYREVDLRAMLKTTAELLESHISFWFFEQVLSDWRRCFNETGKDLIPFLIYKGNSRPFTIVTTKEVWDAFQLQGKINCMHVHLVGFLPLVVFDEVDFFNHCPKDAFLLAYQRYLSNKKVTT